MTTIKYTHSVAVAMTDLDPMTFDDLSALYRAEMTSPMLSGARKDLYPALVRLQEDTRKAYESEYSKDPDSIMCEGMNERRKKVISYIQKVIDLRMEKVAKMALRASMGADNPLDKLTSDEREYYNSVVDISKKLRTSVLKDAKRYVIPNISAGEMNAERIVEKVIVEEHVQDDTASIDPDIEDNVGEALIGTPNTENSEPPEERLMIRILEDLPKIAGPDCDYELRKEEVVWMPAALAQALINHEKAVLMNVTP